MAIDLRQLMEFAKVCMARIGLVASAYVAGGRFIAYTFLEPYLRNTLDFEQRGIALMLAGYAASGIARSFAGERFPAAH